MSRATDRHARVIAHGVVLGLRAPDEALLERLEQRLPAPWKPSAAKAASRTYELSPASGRGPSATYRLGADDDELEAAASLDAAVDRFESNARFFVASTSSLRAFVHAGVVSWQNRAVVIPGQPGAGKTTLTAALVRAGARYLSDEFAPIDERGRVHPFPKSLSMLYPGASRSVPMPVEELGGTQELRSLPVGLVVLTSYEGPAARWSPVELTPGEAVLELLQHAASAERHPVSTLQRLRAVALSAPTLKGPRGDADTTAESILARLDAQGMPRGESRATVVPR
jgi:hypothetical protein